MKIEITEDEIKLNVDGKLQRFEKGDTVTVSDIVGALCVKHGWANDVDGKMETGARVPGANGPIEPDSVTQELK